MDLNRQVVLERKINRHHAALNEILSGCKDTEEYTFITASNVGDALKMLMIALCNTVSSEEAKAAFKIVVDCTILDYGMVVAKINGNEK